MLSKIGIWCNGNTADSGPAFPGSSPGIPTKTLNEKSSSVFFVYGSKLLSNISPIAFRLPLYGRGRGERPLLYPFSNSSRCPMINSRKVLSSPNPLNVTSTLKPFFSKAGRHSPSISSRTCTPLASNNGTTLTCL